MRQSFEDITKLVNEYSKKLKRKKNVISIVQLGSSLRKEDFKPNSDIDFLVIYKNFVKKFVESDEINGVEIDLIRRGRKQFLKSVKEGNPVDLISLKFGKVLFDKSFFNKMKNKKFKPNVNTIKRWIHTANFNFMDAAMNYSLPFCMCCYFKSIHHAAREFCRVIILKENNELVEGDKLILKKLKSEHPDLARKFHLIIKGRENYDKFEQKYLKYPKIKNSGIGKYLLATEDIAIKSLKISMGLDIPKVNKIISQIQKEYEIGHYHSFYIIPETEEMRLHLILKDCESVFFTYNLKSKEFTEIHNTGINSKIKCP